MLTDVVLASKKFCVCARKAGRITGKKMKVFEFLEQLHFETQLCGDVLVIVNALSLMLLSRLGMRMPFPRMVQVVVIFVL